jgi:hypothetical protein
LRGDSLIDLFFHETTCVYYGTSSEPRDSAGCCGGIERTGLQLSENGVTVLTVNTAAAFLQNFCGDRIVRLGFWPPRSPDLALPDFFLLAFLKERAYIRNSGNSVKIVNACLEEYGRIESFIYPTDAQLDCSKNVNLH